MSRNTTGTAHRKINVDAFEEGVYVEEETTAMNDSSVEQRMNSVHQLLRGGQYEKALLAAIAEPPFNADKSVKDKNVKMVAEVLASYKSADIASTVASLSVNDRATLLKFIYRAMEFPAETNCAMVLAWHKAVVEVAGEGAIAFVISDRQRV